MWALLGFLGSFESFGSFSTFWAVLANRFGRFEPFVSRGGPGGVGSQPGHEPQVSTPGSALSTYSAVPGARVPAAGDTQVIGFPFRWMRPVPLALPQRSASLWAHGQVESYLIAGGRVVSQ